MPNLGDYPTPFPAVPQSTDAGKGGRAGSGPAGESSPGEQASVAETEQRGKKSRTARATGRVWMTLADLCDELRISRSTFYDWRVKGKGPLCITLPNRELRIDRAEYDRWTKTLGDMA